MTCCCGHGPFHSHVTQNPRFKSCQFLSAPKVFFTCLQTMPGFRLAAWHSWRMTPETICFSPSAVVNNFLDRAIRLATCSVVLYLVFTGVSILFHRPSLHNYLGDGVGVPNNFHQIVLSQQLFLYKYSYAEIIFTYIVIHTLELLPNNKMNIASRASLTTLK